MLLFSCACDIWRMREWRCYRVLFFNFIVRGLCIVIYSYDKSQQAAIFLKFIYDKELRSTVHHKESQHCVCSNRVFVMLVMLTASEVRSIPTSLTDSWHNLQCQLYIYNIYIYIYTSIYIYILLWWSISRYQAILLHCILYSYSTLSIVQPDDGHYRRPKHVVASFSHQCYKYIYSCVLTTLCTILYFEK